MSVKCKELIDFMEEVAPVDLAEDWDNVGLMLGSTNQEINRILVCLDVTDRVADEAISLKADMIISHHPFLFKGLKRIVDTDIKGKIIYKLIKSDIGVYSSHTNLDVAGGGVNEQLAKVLELNDVGNLNKYKHKPELKGKEYGLGKVGFLKEAMDFEKFLNHVKVSLGVEKLRVIGNTTKDVKKVAVFCGSFDEDYSGLNKSGADVLVTGDIKYHAAVDMIEKGLCVIDASHFNTESVMIPALVKLINDKFSQLEVIASRLEDNPIKII
jgi:GTP cyclohydrolase I